MKKTMTSLLLIVAITATAAVWAERGQRVSTESKVERMAEHLNLSVEQQAAVLSLLEAKRAERQAARASGAEADRAASRAAFEAELQTILTEEQFAAFQERPKRSPDNERQRRPRS